MKKINVAEIGAVNMGEIGAVRKRSRYETGPHDSSPCVARVKILDRVGACLFPMLQLHIVSNGPSGEPAAPTAEFIIVVSNVPASQCFEWTECII